MVVTSTNNKFYFWLNLSNGVFTSDLYNSKIDCLQAFCKAMREREEVIWGQFICHHYADEWQGEATEVLLTLNNKD